MKRFLVAFAALAPFFLSCKKNVEQSPPASIDGKVVQSENALYPEPCHATVFTTNYATLAGKVPPFRFSKTQYASGRIRTINMLSRANPNHPAFKQQAWEVIGTFTYYSNKAILTGTKQLWEYYKSSTGAALKRSVVKKNITLTFTFGVQEPFAERTGKVTDVYNNIQHATALRMRHNTVMGLLFTIQVLAGSDEPDNYFEGRNDGSSFNPITRISSIGTQAGTPAAYSLRKTINYKYALDGNYENVYRAYQPTQNWISLEYTLCEVMGWIGFGLDGVGNSSERTSVEVRFYPYNTSSLAIQSQYYRNHKYANANLLSYTYADGVLQKNVWICK